MNQSTQDCIYLRKSRLDTDTKSSRAEDTLARHETQLLELARQERCCIRGIYREVVSADTIQARPVVRQLLAEVGAGLWRSVLVMDIDRLARGSTRDQGLISELFKDSGTRIITPQKTYDPQNEYDEEYMEFGLFMSRREYKLINRRIQRGRLQSAREGKYTGNIPPYGYDRQKLSGEKGWTLTPNPIQAPVVRLVFTRSCEMDDTRPGARISLAALARELTARSLPAPKGGLWSASSVRTLLRNPVYAGYIKYGARPRIRCVQPPGSIFSNGAFPGGTVWTPSFSRPCVSDCPLFPGRHPPLVSRKLFLKAQERFPGQQFSLDDQ